MQKSAYFLIMFATLTVFISCKSPCENVTTIKNVTFLIDNSDPSLFEKTKEDLDNHGSDFMSNSPLFQIGDCDVLSFYMGGIGAQNDLDIPHITIDPTNAKGNIEKDAAKDLTPLVALYQKQIKLLEAKSLEKESSEGSRIGQNIIKALKQQSAGGLNYVFVFTDGIENNSYVNFYKVNLKNANVQEISNKMIGADLVNEIKKTPFPPTSKVIFVLKEDAMKSVPLRDVTLFWKKFFSNLKIEAQFVDNLSHQINL